MRTTLPLALSFAAALALSACGGGSESAADPSAPITEYQTGVFLDSAVEGVGYRTESGAGLTDSQGRFRYRAGESVTFSIGNTTLGTASASPVVTPLNFAPDGTVETDPRVANVLVLLQSLDDDANPRNGIRITSATRTSFAEAHPLNPGQAPLGFVGDSSSTDLLTEATRQNTIPRNSFVSVDSAMRHFSATTTEQWYQGEWELSWGAHTESVVVNSLGVLVLPKATPTAAGSSEPSKDWVEGIAGYVSPTGVIQGQLAVAPEAHLRIYSLDMQLLRNGSASGELRAHDGSTIPIRGRRTSPELHVPPTLARYVGDYELDFEGAADVTEDCAWDAKCVSGRFSLRIEPDGSASATPNFDQREGQPSLDLSYVGHLAPDGTLSLYLEPPAKDERCLPVLLDPFAGMFSYSLIPSQMVLDGQDSPGGWGAKGIDVKGKVAADDEYCKRYSRPNSLGPILTMPPAGK